MKPICVPCQRFYRMKKDGYYFLEMMPLGRNVREGTAEPDRWQPYKLWVGDLWECPDCHAQIVSGTGREPLAEHYQEGFAAHVERLGAAQLKVNDC